jgi:hypothetical protein
MKDKERTEDESIDPPENQGGGSPSDGSLDESDEFVPTEPPSNSGNTTLSDL